DGPQKAAPSRRHRHPLDPEGELLEELRKTMERMRALEKLKPGIDRVARSRRTPNIDETGPKRPPRRAPRARPFPGRKATALVVVTLFVATAVALVLYNSQRRPRSKSIRLGGKTRPRPTLPSRRPAISGDPRASIRLPSCSALGRPACPSSSPSETWGTRRTRRDGAIS